MCDGGKDQFKLNVRFPHIEMGNEAHKHLPLLQEGN